MDPRLDQLLQPFLSDAVTPDPAENRYLCHSVGATQVQPAALPEQGCTGLVCAAPPRRLNALCTLAPMYGNGRTSRAVSLERVMHGSGSARAEFPPGDSTSCEEFQRPPS